MSDIIQTMSDIVFYEVRPCKKLRATKFKLDAAEFKLDAAEFLRDAHVVFFTSNAIKTIPDTAHAISGNISSLSYCITAN